MFHVYRSQMLIYQTFSFQNLLLSLNFSLIVSIDYCLLQILIYNSKFFLNFCNVSVPCILIFLKKIENELQIFNNKIQILLNDFQILENEF